ncbi:MAG: AGE family epimerase/isomerase [Fibrobacteria bacterium]|nr:AGE family epimerase/isomerase [Fibrobacteria bacterium]
MQGLSFEFSDTIAGYVTRKLEDGSFAVRTSDGRDFEIKLSKNVYARLMRNLQEPWLDCTGTIADLLVPGQFVFSYGTFYPDGDVQRFEVQVLDFPGKKLDKFRFEEPDWWIKQAKSIADFFIKAQFGGPESIDYRKYRTTISLTGEQSGTVRQETDTISRLVYGFASTFLMTGEDKYLEAAEKGTKYLHDHMRFFDVDENVAYWYHGIDVQGDSEHKVFASEFGDDYDAIPAYEQIYALAGPTQTFRITGNPEIRKDIDLTLALFEKFFIDRDKGGYFSHIDPVMLDPRAESLGPNRAKKNWNSVGDHAPAFLINLFLATGEKEHLEMLEFCAKQIVDHFPDYDWSPFVQERFHEDWSPDRTWGWQQDRAVVGHNLKIAWNLMRIHSQSPRPEYKALAEKIASLMPQVGYDAQRGGWYDVMERTLAQGEKFHRFAWHDRKAWWQQEQGILAYQILWGILGKEEYLKYARESAAFYNTFFLDYSDGAVYFNVLSTGIPYLLGTERFKGSHSMSGYHSIELAYLSTTYINLLHTKQPMAMYFKPYPGGFADNILRVAPDMLPKGSVTIGSVEIDGEPYADFDAEALTVKIPVTTHRPKIKVTLVPR